MKVKGTVTLNAYAIIRRAVEEGVAHGWRRAHKYSKTPTKDTARDAIEDEVMLALSEVVEWPEMVS